MYYIKNKIVILVVYFSKISNVACKLTSLLKRKIVNCKKVMN